MVSSPSPWRVSRESSPYMWRCLLYFVGLGVAPRPPALARAPPGSDGTSSIDTTPADSGSGGEGGGGSCREREGVDFEGWVRRVKERGPVIEAHNVDVLFSLGEGQTRRYYVVVGGAG